MTRRQQEIAALEASSTAIRNTQPWCRASCRPPITPVTPWSWPTSAGQADVAAAVAARLRRQEVLYDASRQFDYVLPESALHGCAWPMIPH